MRSPCGDKLNLKKPTGDEDVKILSYISSKHVTGNWTSSITEKTAMKRCGKNCKVRWNNYKRAADLKHEAISFTTIEEDMIIKLHAAIGSRWSIIAQQLPGRTEIDVKNHWNTKLRKKLKEMGIDPVTHKPYSQILVDYVNIGGNSSRSSNYSRVGSINKDLKATIAAKRVSDSSININNVATNTHGSTTVTAAAMVTSTSRQYPETTTTKASRHNNINISATNNNGSNKEMVMTDIDDESNSHQLDLFSQLQAITLVTDASHSDIIINPTMDIVPTNFGAQIHPPSSSITSSSTTMIASNPFAWRDFLLEDAFLSNTIDDHSDTRVENVMNYDHLSSSILGQSDEMVRAYNKNEVVKSNRKLIIKDIATSSSSPCGEQESSSFVEELLDQESNMFLDYLSLVPDEKEPLYY